MLYYQLVIDMTLVKIKMQYPVTEIKEKSVTLLIPDWVDKENILSYIQQCKQEIILNNIDITETNIYLEAPDDDFEIILIKQVD